MKVLLIFIDGLGIAEPVKESNPAYHLTPGYIFARIPELPQEGSCFPLDATMGVKGLPQSATGQTSLYTGINAQKFIGKHLSGYPNLALRKLLYKHSLFVILKNRGKRCLFINAFRHVFFSSTVVHNISCESHYLTLRE